jgi:hypothetical protein
MRTSLAKIEVDNVNKVVRGYDKLGRILFDNSISDWSFVLSNPKEIVECRSSTASSTSSNDGSSA